MQQLISLDSILSAEDLFKVLGVPQAAGYREVLVAYQQLKERIVPESFPEPSDNEKAHKALERVKEAFFILNNPDKRHVYEQQLRKKREPPVYEQQLCKKREPPPSQESPEKPATGDKQKLAETHFNKGLYLEAHHQLDEAIAEYEEAISHGNHNAKYHSRLGLVLEKKGWCGYSQAEFKIALMYDPTDDLALKHYHPSSDTGQPKDKASFLDQFRHMFRKTDEKIRIGDILMRQGILNEKQLEIALKRQRKEKLPLGEILIRMKWLKPEQLAKALILQSHILEQSH